MKYIIITIVLLFFIFSLILSSITIYMLRKKKVTITKPITKVETEVEQKVEQEVKKTFDFTFLVKSDVLTKGIITDQELIYNIAYLFKFHKLLNMYTAHYVPRIKNDEIKYKYKVKYPDNIVVGNTIYIETDTDMTNVLLMTVLVGTIITKNGTAIIVTKENKESALQLLINANKI